MASIRPPILGFGKSSNPSLLATLPPLSLYIHMPWCVRKCPYCDFNSHQVKSAVASATQAPIGVTALHPLGTRFPIAGEGLGKPGNTLSAEQEQRYIDALIADLDVTLPKVWGRRVHTIFFGGGTPSLFSSAGIDAILAAVRARLPVEADAEITLEANPGTFEADKFKGYRDAGVNRLSIGIQSFNAKHLTALGRVHNDTEAKRAIEIAQANFDNINLDIMFALPSQTFADCEQDIETALAFGTNHLSIYHLTLEPNTLFHRFPPTLPDDELAADMQEMIVAKLSAGGFQHYETSAYAKPGKQCRHNLNYWRFGDYIGIGAGAHGKISFPDRITREVRYKQPNAFMEKAVLGEAIQEASTVGLTELPFEFMLNALRLTAVFPVALFTERTGLPINKISCELDAAEAKGLINRDHLHITPTVKGRLFLNDLLEIFLPAARERK
ncbi:MAG: radical SAM family heme chaperone HemW [Burkholderiales bacterium]